MLNMKLSVSFMQCFMIHKRSRVICIFSLFKQFTVALKWGLRKCQKSATAVLKGEMEGTSLCT